MSNLYVWSDVALAGVIGAAIFAVPAYWVFRKFFPVGDSKAVLTQIIAQRDAELRLVRKESANLSTQLMESVENNHSYEEMKREVEGLTSRLSDVEGRYADAEREIEFWRNKDNITAAADIYYTLCLDYKDEIARFGSVIAWVDHLKSIHDQVKLLAGILQHDSED